jgi:hypothetical protein
MFNLEDEVGFDAGDGGEEVVEDLLGGHAEFAAAGGDFQPAIFVAEVAFGEIFGADGNEIGVVGEFHVGGCGRWRHYAFLWRISWRGKVIAGKASRQSDSPQIRGRPQMEGPGGK